VIKVSGLQKSFKLYHRPADRLKEIVLRRGFHSRYQALEDVSFEVADGETLGIIGRNGAGKSTLLKILNGVVLPDGGSVETSGRVTGLLELGTGFDFAMSGIANIRTNGLLLGMTEEELTRRRDDIIEFAELGRFIHEPLRTYSSGMVMRLAFAIAIHADPDIFLVDEALSVGDGHFQQKCMRRIRDFRANGGSIIFVSHDLNAVKMLCDRVIVLSDGRVLVDGEPEFAANTYYQLLGGDDEFGSSAVIERGYGNFQASIVDVRVEGVDSRCDVLSGGEEMSLAITVKAEVDIAELTVGLTIRDRFGQDIFGTNSYFMDFPLTMAAGATICVNYRMAMILAPGKYTISIALHDGPEHTRNCYHWWDNASQFEVSGNRDTHFIGVCNLRPSISLI